MLTYKIGLDFGTHQTKVCLEDSSDRRNKRYFFHRFTDGEGCEQYTIPSTVMVKKDHTLAYGYVDESEVLHAIIAPLTEKPTEPKLVLWTYPPEPQLPNLPSLGEPPQPPDYDAIASKRPKPIKPKKPSLQESPEANTPEQVVLNDFSDLKKLLKPQPPQQNLNDFTKAMKQYRRAMKWYEKEMRKYESWLNEEISAAKKDYDNQRYEFRHKRSKLEQIKIQREQLLNDYAKRCREVEEHNEEARRRMPDREKEYKAALQRWDEDRMRPKPVVMRHFKQALFSSGLVWRYEWSPMLVSIWYLTYVFFDLDEKYGTDNLVCMGTSSGVKTWNTNKEIATQVMLTVYYLIEEVFHHDRKAFLRCTVDELVRLTTIVPYSDDAKRDNSIYVFPEAYANLNPMALRGKFGEGMNLVVDIGGGTTDISLFSAPYGQEVMIYDYISVPYGLNAIKELGLDRYALAVSQNINGIVQHVKNHARHIGVPESEISRVLQKRPIVYTGGGSTRPELCCEYVGFTDIKHLRDNIGDSILIEDKATVVRLMAILSTALGLAMCKEDDREIKIQSIQKLFQNVEEAYREKRQGVT